jgi:glycosyltransferase involved in cell wall biosynthesis
MNILIYSETFWPDMGGMERNTYTLSKCLANQNHRVTLLTATPGGKKDEYPFQVVRTSRKFDILLHVFKSDRVIINGGISAKVCLFAIGLKRPYYVIYQTSELFSRRGQGFLIRVNNGMRKWMAENAKMNICVSHYATTCLELNNKNVAALVNPIDEELERIYATRSGQSIKKKYDLLFAGRLIEGKGIFILLDAILTLNRKDLSVAVAGEGKDRSQLEELAKKKGLTIAFRGRLDREELIELYMQSKVLIVPSSTHIEGFPLVISEALSVGTPVIASNQPAMVEAVGDAGLIFESFNSTDLAGKIKVLLDNPDVLKEKMQNAVKRKDVFSSKTYERKLNEIMADNK